MENMARNGFVHEKTYQYLFFYNTKLCAPYVIDHKAYDQCQKFKKRGRVRIRPLEN